MSQVRSIRPDLIVLDLGLPGLDGLDVARTVRQSLGVPIIMLTARSDEAESAEISSPPHQWADKRSPQATFVERWNLVVLVRSSRVSLRDPDGGESRGDEPGRGGCRRGSASPPMVGRDGGLCGWGGVGVKAGDQLVRSSRPKVQSNGSATAL